MAGGGGGAGRDGGGLARLLELLHVRHLHRRLEALQKKLDARVLTQDVLQVLRAIEVLELIDNAEVRKLVEVMAKGAPGHRITEEAAEALRRLAPR